MLKRSLGLILLVLVLLVMIAFTYFSDLFANGVFIADSICLKRSGPVNSAQPVSKIDPVIAELADQITEGLQNDYAKMAAIYDWVTVNIDYDLKKAANIAGYGSGALYAIETNSGVCHDYAELTRDLLLSAGIEARYVRGEVTVEQGRTEMHAWNEAVIGADLYALDTTWGSGFTMNDQSTYIKKPRRLYLTSVNELQRLHSDPGYKQEREEDYLQQASAAEPLLILNSAEAELLDQMNSYRAEQGITLLEPVGGLLNLAREHAGRSAEAICADQDVDLDLLGGELAVLAPSMGARSAGMHIVVKWLFPLESEDTKCNDILLEMEKSLGDSRYGGVTVAAVQKGDLQVFVVLFLEYY